MTRIAELKMKPRPGMKTSKLRSFPASEDSVLEGEDLLFSSREDDRGLDQFCALELVFIFVGTSAGESLPRHPPVHEGVLHKHVPIPVEHRGEKVGIIVGTVHQALVFESIQDVQAVAH